MNQKRQIGKKIVSCLLCITMALSFVNLPGFAYEAHASSDDGHECSLCGEWRLEEVFDCDDCDYCEVCHVDEDYEHDGRCPECRTCYFEIGDFCSVSGLCAECCIEYQTHCEECDACFCGEAETKVCEDCGKCSECTNLCEDCNHCEDDWDDYHCEECGNCIEADGNERCASGGDHCQECCEYNDWICEACGECMETLGVEACDICGRCEECCEATRCPDCGMCEEDTDFDEHFCEDCGECMEGRDICDTCGLCLDCCHENAQSLGCECEEYCWTDSDILDHICEDCGTCFGITDSCDICEKANVRRCVDCCKELSYFYGCDCDEYVCTSSNEWTEHVKRHTITDGIHAVSPQKSWNADDTMHWHVCRWCEEDDHITMKSEHILDSKGRCIVCGYSTLDDILIVGQPKDVTGRVTDGREEKPTDNSFSIRVNAWGKGGTEGLLYHWYSCNADGTRKYDNLSKMDFVSGVFSKELVVGILTDACTAGENHYICQITDGYGNEAWTRVATFKAKHSFKMLNYKSTDITAEHHVLRCVGDDCFPYDEDARVQGHDFCDWIYKDLGDGKGKKYRVCSVCGYKKEVLYHNEHHGDFRGLYDINSVITLDPEKNDGKYEGYYTSEQGEVKEFGGNLVWHWETCAEEGCSVKVREYHEYAGFQSDDKMPTESGQTASGYRQCDICGYQDSVLHTSVDSDGNIRNRIWGHHTHPVEFTNRSGYSNYFVAFEEEPITIYPRLNGKNKMDSIKITIEGVNRTLRPITKDLSKSLVEIKKYREYEIVIPKSTQLSDYLAYPLVVEVTYSDELCPHDEGTTLENAQEATCAKEGYTGDEICVACGAIVVHGKTIPAKRHGKSIPVTESVRKQVWAKGSNGKYSWQDAKDRNGYYIYERHARVYYSCTDHEYSEKGSYTGDYVCEDCGEITIKGKYTEVEHDYTRADLAVLEWPKHSSGYSWNYLIYELWGAKPLKYATTTEEGYTGDYVCYDCHNIKRGRVIPVMEPKYIENVSIDIQAPIPKLPVEKYNDYCKASVLSKPARGFGDYEINWMKKGSSSFMQNRETFEEGEEYIAVVKAYVNVDDSETRGVYVNNYVPLGIPYDYVNRRMVADNTYKGTVTFANLDHVDYDYNFMYFYSKPMKASYVPINDIIEISDYKKPIVGKTFGEFMPKIQVSKFVTVRAEWYKSVYDYDGKTLIERVPMNDTDVVEGETEYTLRVVLEADNQHVFDVTGPSTNYTYNGIIRVPNKEVKSSKFSSDYKLVTIFNPVTTPKVIKGKSAGCTTDGIKDYYELGGKYYSDAECKNEIKDLASWKTGDGKIAKKGHTSGATTCIKKATTTQNGKLETKCSVCGEVTATKTIKAAKTIKLSATKYTYDGKIKKPTVTVKNSAGTTLKKDTNYTVTYASGRKAVGKYKVTIKGKGNYSFTKSLYFKINPVKTSITSLTKGTKSFTVKWSKKTVQTTGYEIQYSTSSTFKAGTATKKVTVKSNKTTSKTIKSLKAKKKYYVRVRTYKTVSGTKYYSAWCTKKTVTTK